jgi:hypothetical protein
MSCDLPRSGKRKYIQNFGVETFWKNIHFQKGKRKLEDYIKMDLRKRRCEDGS